MAKASFHSVRGEKGTTALILLKQSAFQFGATPVYVPLEAVAEALSVDADELAVFTKDTPVSKEDAKKYTFEIPDGYSLVESFDENTGEVVTSGDGSPLLRIEY